LKNYLVDYDAGSAGDFLISCIHLLERDSEGNKLSNYKNNIRIDKNSGKCVPHFTGLYCYDIYKPKDFSIEKYLLENNKINIFRTHSAFADSGLPWWEEYLEQNQFDIKFFVKYENIEEVIEAKVKFQLKDGKPEPRNEQQAKLCTLKLEVSNILEHREDYVAIKYSDLCNLDYQSIAVILNNYIDINVTECYEQFFSDYRKYGSKWKDDIKEEKTKLLEIYKKSLEK
jgi:hypothetical protein